MLSDVQKVGDVYVALLAGLTDVQCEESLGTLAAGGQSWWRWLRTRMRHATRDGSPHAGPREQTQEGLGSAQPW